MVLSNGLPVRNGVIYSALLTDLASPAALQCYNTFCFAAGTDALQPENMHFSFYLCLNITLSIRIAPHISGSKQPITSQPLEAKPFRFYTSKQYFIASPRLFMGISFQRAKRGSVLQAVNNSLPGIIESGCEVECGCILDSR